MFGREFRIAVVIVAGIVLFFQILPKLPAVWWCCKNRGRPNLVSLVFYITISDGSFFWEVVESWVGEDVEVEDEVGSA